MKINQSYGRGNPKWGQRQNRFQKSIRSSETQETGKANTLLAESGGGAAESKTAGQGLKLEQKVCSGVDVGVS